jgi:hypothetical protein
MWFKNDILEVYFGKKYSEFVYNTKYQFLVVTYIGAEERIPQLSLV